MSDELGRNQLTSQLKYWQQECRICAEHHNYNCNECVCRKRCLQAKKQIKELIQKPGVTEEWIWKAIEYIREYPTYHRLEEKLKEAGISVA